MRKLILTIALVLTVLPVPAYAQRRVTVMTQNLDFGSDLGEVLAATSFSELVAATTATFAAVVATNIPARMQAVANEIAKTQPDLIGLQEAALLRSGPFTAPRTPATTIEFDLLQLLLDALAARGLQYTPVAITMDFDAQVPGLTSGGICCLERRLTDRDVILARTDLTVSNIQTANFATNLQISILGSTLTILRGWASVDAHISDTTFRFVTTHFEAIAPAVQVAQAQELLLGPANTPLPVVLVCDCNAPAPGSQGPDPMTATYGNLLAAGFVDAWSEAHPGAAGFTCCQVDTLDQHSALSERIDFVFVRDGFGVHAAKRVGATPGDRTPFVSPPVPPARLWPSDHAGVVGTLETDQ